MPETTSIIDTFADTVLADTKLREDMFAHVKDLSIKADVLIREAEIHKEMTAGMRVLLEEIRDTVVKVSNILERVDG